MISHEKTIIIIIIIVITFTITETPLLKQKPIKDVILFETQLMYY